MSTQALRKKTKPAVRGRYLLTVLLCVTACATDGGAPRGFDPADTGSRIVLVSEGAPLKVVRPPARLEPVELTQAEYEAAMAQLARQLRDQLPSRPEKRLEVISWGSPEKRNEQDVLVQEYLQWREERGTPGDCWDVLKGQRYLSDEAKRDLAFALATEGVWLGTATVIDEVLDPVQLQLAIMVSLTTTMALLAIPEPISKLIVIGLTLSLVAYVGWDTLSGIIEGWRHMDAAARRARTFSELRAAGRRFGQMLGEKVTRLLILNCSTPSRQTLIWRESSTSVKHKSTSCHPLPKLQMATAGTIIKTQAECNSSQQPPMSLHVRTQEEWQSGAEGIEHDCSLGALSRHHSSTSDPS